MVARKRMLVLANSAKVSERCIAGREVVPVGENSYRLGPWLRPVSDQGQGELRIQQRLYPNKREVQVLDFAEVALLEKVNDLYQPENWRIARFLPWANISHDYAPACVDALQERPLNLWLQPDQPRTDRVAHAYLVAHPPGRSLCIVRAERFRFRLFPQDGITRRSPRCLFRYAGVEYEMGLTDPVIIDGHRSEMPAFDEPPVEIVLPSGDDPLVLVSLTGDFHGYHYKVVATVFERPR